MAISAQQVKALRDQTGAGMMDCKKALQETGGDLEEAVLYLQKKGMASAAKKAGRTAAEGIAHIHRSDDMRSATLAEVNCETDFVARNEAFISFVEDLTRLAHEQGITDVEALTAAKNDKGQTVDDWTREQISNIGENIQVRRLVRYDAEDTGIVGAYVHAGSQIAVMVQVRLSGHTADEAEDFAKNVAMHVAASNPEYVSDEEIDQAAVDHQTQVLTAQAKESGKPDNIIAKMVEGRIQKWKKEIALLHQPYVKDPDMSVGQYQDKFGGAEIEKFIRYQVGEGIEKNEANLADEVAQALKS